MEEPVVSPCPVLPIDIARLRDDLLRRFGEPAELEMWRYVAWYENRFGIDDAQLVWIKAVNRTAEKYRTVGHGTGAIRRGRFGRDSD